MSGHGHIVRIRDQKRWSEQEKQRARELRATGMYFQDVADMMGKTENAVRSFFKRDNPEYKARERSRANERERQLRRQRNAGIFTGRIKYNRVPEGAVAERDARSVERDTLSLTQQFFGDPEPSRSALHKQKTGTTHPGVRMVRITLATLKSQEAA